MDFLSLTRRELQAICKKNKIPANITNVAMAEALKALEIVEGIEELMQPSQSGTAQSSIESLEMAEVTSPFVPPAAGRSTRHINIAKEVTESVNPTTRTRRTTRKTQVKDADAIETPALIAQTNRKKGQMASARRNMDAQLKECVDEDKRDFLVTPVPMGGTSRRRRLEESAVKRVYSTRRSVRLAEKNNVEMLNEVENEESQLFKKELVTKDGGNEKMDLKDCVDNFNELSGITDVDAITTIEEKSGNKYEFEVVSDQKPDTPIGKDEFEAGSDQKKDTSIGKDESEVVSDQKKDTSIGEDELEVVPDQKRDTSIVKDEFEAVSDQKQDTSIGEEIKMGFYAEEEECTNFETESKLEEEKSDTKEGMPLNVSNEEVQQNDGSQDVYISEIEITVEKSTEELTTEEGAASEDEAADFVENVILENGDNFVVDESSCDNTGIHDEIEEELNNDIMDGGSKDVTDLNVTLVKLTELTLQQATKEADSDFIDHWDIHVQKDEPGEIEILRLEESKKSADHPPVPSDGPYADFSEQISTSGVDDVEMTFTNGFQGLENEPNENHPTKIEILQLEESEKAADSVPSDEPYDANFSEQIAKSGVDVETSHPFSFEGLDSHVNVQPTCLTPSKNSASKASITMKSRTCFSDNKENIGSGNKLVIMKDVKMAKKSENVDNLLDLSVRKLSKMLKEKLEITKKKSSKNENGNEATSRPALQTISEN